MLYPKIQQKILCKSNITKILLFGLSCLILSTRQDLAKAGAVLNSTVVLWHVWWCGSSISSPLHWCLPDVNDSCGEFKNFIHPKDR